MNIVAIVQARMGSTRLPGKVLKKVNDEEVLGLLLKRLSQSKCLTSVCVATTNEPSDDEIIDYLRGFDVQVYRGSSDDVLNRYYCAALSMKAEIVVRITGDCPLVDPELVDQIICRFLDEGVDYASNTLTPTFPDGLDVEVFKFSILEQVQEVAVDKFDREHVTPYIKSSTIFTKLNVLAPSDYSQFRWTVDESVDLVTIEEILNLFPGQLSFGWLAAIDHPDFPKLKLVNSGLRRNEGSIMSKGQKLWKRAKQVIPGGNMLLSKRPEMFLPDLWPSYFTKADGCRVFDLDNVMYTDVSIMGIGTNLLGYGHPKVDEAVVNAISNGNMSTLNCPEEVYLAERLVELHPWSDMVRFARTGGEANAIAVRIARAATSRTGVAICGYHGWHDWYLATNLANDEGLTEHLLPGLESNGVPNQLSGSVHPFHYNDFSTLSKIIATKDIGVVIMEVMRNVAPKEDFLQKVRDLCDRNGIVLIFDECTSGFRETFGGLHLKYNVNPDIAMFGKALGNGYAITAIVGRREVMEFAQSSFISSTFWTEKIGPAAALATLDVMDDTKSWEVVTKTGLEIKENWEKIADKHHLKITQSGLPALASFSFKEDHLVRKTFFIQEMLKRNYLASNSFYPSLAHNDTVIERYFEVVDEIFEEITLCETSNQLQSKLVGRVCHDGFQRLN